MSVGSSIRTLFGIAFVVTLTAIIPQGVRAVPQAVRAAPRRVRAVPRRARVVRPRIRAAQRPVSVLPVPERRDATALVRQMIHTYQGATTLQDSADAIFLSPQGEKTHQTTITKFKRANQLRMEMQDPTNGTLMSYCNGRTVTVYSGTQNIFTKRTAPLEFVRVVRTMEQALDDMTRVKSGQMLSPVSFLYASGLPREAENFTLLGTAKLDKHDVYVVVGQASQAWLRELTSEPQTFMDKKDVVLWIDRRTHLLVQAIASVHWRIPISDAKSKQKKFAVGGFTFKEAHHDTRLNAPIPDEEFHFRPPTKARELFVGQQ